MRRATERSARAWACTRRAPRDFCANSGQTPLSSECGQKDAKCLLGKGAASSVGACAVVLSCPSREPHLPACQAGVSLECRSPSVAPISDVCAKEGVSCVLDGVPGRSTTRQGLVSIAQRWGQRRLHQQALPHRTAHVRLRAMARKKATTVFLAKNGKCSFPLTGATKARGSNWNVLKSSTAAFAKTRFAGN